MSTKIPVQLGAAPPAATGSLLRIIGERRQIELFSCQSEDESHTLGREKSPPGTNEPKSNLLEQIQLVSSTLARSGRPLEADVLQEIYSIGVSPTDLGGLGLQADQSISAQHESELLFLTSAHLEALNSAERSKSPNAPLAARPNGRRGMTLGEKILAAHDVDRKGEVKAGDVIRVDVDWVLASELSWGGMEKFYDQLGKPGIFRNDRFWLAGDHVVDPRIMDHPKIKPLIEASQRAKKGFRMTENQGMNYTIMHTEFCRQRAQPGMLVIGSDSHTCSAGSVSSLAIGLGVADVLLTLVTGETWFKVPESVQIRLINKPNPGIGGKDIILYILKELKRNTLASDRIVEYTGPGLRYLSCDARFAISNMTTEFGGVTGIFTPDPITQGYIDGRKNPKHKSSSIYFQPDSDATYAATKTLDLAQVEPFVARYPKPDDVVPVTEMVRTKLQGCFMGACTTTEEDLVLAALLLEEGLRRGMQPVKQGKRKVVPGSMPILNNLKKTGLVEIFEKAGFEVGVPGCSYCVGMSADKAGEGETWLTSQNRNFENRMGPGAFGNLASAVTVAASSFEMEITNPKTLLDAVDLDRFRRIVGQQDRKQGLLELRYVEPGVQARSSIERFAAEKGGSHDTEKTSQPNPDDLLISRTDPLAEPPKTSVQQPPPSAASASILSGNIALLGDFVDTDALAPSEALIKPDITPEELGTYCLYHTHPGFHDQVREGQNIVVAGEAFGCGSSRENAVTALQGAGVQCVIAKSFAFIYGRNQPNLGLLGFEMKDENFWRVVQDGSQIRINLDTSTLELGIGDPDETMRWEEFSFQLSPMQRGLMECGGAAKAFGTWGKQLWQTLCSGSKKEAGQIRSNDLNEFSGLETTKMESRLQW